MNGALFLLLTGVPSVLLVAVALHACFVRRAVAWGVALLLALVGSWWSYHILGAVPDLRLAKQLANYDLHSELPDAALLRTVRERLAVQPENPHYLALLAHAAMETENWQQAAHWQKRMMDLAPADADLLANYALSLSLSRNDGIDAEVKQLLSRSLVLDPQQPLALSLRGQMAFLDGEKALALGYWRRALRGLPPTSKEASSLRLMVNMLEHKAQP